MLGLPLGGQPPAPPAEASRPPPDQPRWDWIPTPPSSGQAAIPPPGPTLPAPAGSEVALQPPAPDSLQPPPAPGTPPRSPASPFGDDWLNPTPPMAPTPAGGDSPPNNFGGGSLFDSLSPPGGSNQPDSAFDSLFDNPPNLGNGSLFADPRGGLTPPALPSDQPQRPAEAPSATSLINSPVPLEPLPDLGRPIGDAGLSPPPLTPPAVPGRPDNKRQLSEGRVAESRRLLEQGDLDAAVREATEALNADDANYHAYMALSQVYAHQDPQINNFAHAANLAKEAANLGRREWDAWWNCADIFYRWAHRRNLDVQGMSRVGRSAPTDIIDERNQALANARIAIGNSATLAQAAGDQERKKVAVTQGLIAYLQALTVPEPPPPPEGAGRAALDEYRRSQAAYKAAVSQPLTEALPYFQAALRLGTPAYAETFHLGIINFRLAGLERDGGNPTQAANHYQQAARFLDEATTAGDTPPGGPREAYYMLAYCYDLMAGEPGPGRARNKELALRYWRQTADFYAAGTAYRDYALQRIEALSAEMGQ
jgi:tetratricopeptide (TPR) repeat protein